MHSTCKGIWGCTVHVNAHEDIRIEFAILTTLGVKSPFVGGHARIIRHLLNLYLFNNMEYIYFLAVSVKQKFARNPHKIENN